MKDSQIPYEDAVIAELQLENTRLRAELAELVEAGRNTTKAHAAFLRKPADQWGALNASVKAFDAILQKHS